MQHGNGSFSTFQAVLACRHDCPVDIFVCVRATLGFASVTGALLVPCD